MYVKKKRGEILRYFQFSSLMFGTNLERENHFKEVNI